MDEDIKGIWIHCPECKGKGILRVCQGHGDYDNILCPRCNPDENTRMVGIPGPMCGWVKEVRSGS